MTVVSYKPYPLLAVLFWVRRHLVQRLSCVCFPSTVIVTGWILGNQRRLVWRLEWLTLWPNCGDLPHKSHFIADEVTPLLRISFIVECRDSG